MGFRFILIVAVVFLSFSFLVWKLYDLQVAGGNGRASAEILLLNPEFSIRNRGTIYFTDKNGNRLAAAFNKDFPNIYAVPNAIEDPLEAAHLVSPIIGKSADELSDKLSKAGDRYELLVKKADSAVVQAIKSLGLKGVYVETAPQRFYPLESLASQVLGFVGPGAEANIERGRYGVEVFYDDILSGASVTSSRGASAARTGMDVALTIDPGIQIEAEKILSSLVERHKAKGGSVLVMEPRTGKILALGNSPNFNPNNYARTDLSRFLNPAVQLIYEPGSVLKVITMAAGIDSGKITPDTSFVDTGVLRVSGKDIKNYDNKAYGKVTMTKVIEHSINTGAAYAERQTGHALFREYLVKFGLGDKTGVDLPGEIGGDLRRLTPNAPEIAFSTASFGQGIAVTPIELASAISAIANGGMIMRPYLNAELEPLSLRRAIGARAAGQVAQMMTSAVDANKVAQISGYSIAGKTGTAQVPDFKRGGYTDKVVNTYIGFGPTSNPRFVALIKLDEPAGAPPAALTVVPAFRDLAQFILNYYNVPPDRIVSSN